MSEHGPSISQPRDVSLYRVIVADNYHYQDRDEEYVEGDYATEEEAVAVCKRIVELSLSDLIAPGATAFGIYRGYQTFGDDPYVLAPRGAPRVAFSAWKYAKARSDELGLP
jgi:hypothetical protein